MCSSDLFCITHNRSSFEGRIAGVVIYRVALHLNACADGKGRREFVLPLYVRNQHKGRSIRIPSRAKLPIQFTCGIKIQRTIYKRVIVFGGLNPDFHRALRGEFFVVEGMNAIGFSIKHITQIGDDGIVQVL